MRLARRTQDTLQAVRLSFELVGDGSLRFAPNSFRIIIFHFFAADSHYVFASAF
jgi:hypothetical protein